jgi:hypothetical protein
LHAIIKYGLSELVKNYEGKMMGFGNNLSDKDIDGVLAYIKSFWPEDKYNYQINLNRTLMATTAFNWYCNHTWKRSAINTAWCLLGCAIGDFGTILFFQITQIPWPVLAIMILAIINGLITSIILETIILIRQNFKFKDALKTALGMSFISMVSMEIAMNLTDYLLTGGAMLTWWAVPIMLTVGFLTPWPYNYWRLKKFGIACH